MKRIVGLMGCLVMLTGGMAQGEGEGKAKWSGRREAIKEKIAEKKAEIQQKVADWKASHQQDQSSGQGSDSGEEKREAMREGIREKWEKFKAGLQSGSQGKDGFWNPAVENQGGNPAAQGLKEKLSQLKNSLQTKDGSSFKEKLQALKEHWQGMHPKDQATVESKNPGFSQGLKTLFNKTWNVSGTHTGPAGSSQTYEGTQEHKGNTSTQKGTWTGKNGKQTTVSGETTAQDNSLKQQKTWTGENGKSTNLQSETTHEGKAWSTKATVTGPGGKTGQLDATTTHSGNTDSFKRTWTDGKGKETNVDGTRTLVNGLETVKKTLTGPDGKPHAIIGTGVKTGDGYKMEWKNEKGETLTQDVDVSHGSDGTEVKGTWTGPDGKTYTNTNDFQVAPESQTVPQNSP